MKKKPEAAPGEVVKPYIFWDVKEQRWAKWYPKRKALGPKRAAGTNPRALGTNPRSVK